MLPGLSGHLVSEQVLERALSGGTTDAGSSGRARRTLSAWRPCCDQLGPASGLRTLFEVGVAPLVSALGLPAPRSIEYRDGVIAATIPAEAGSLGLVVASWGARLDPLWRVAVVTARERGALWSLMFNGTALRIVSAGRLYARRYAEFNLDLASDDDHTAAALLTLVATQVEPFVIASEREAGIVNRSLRIGVLDASTAVLGALVRRRPRPALEGAFEQALTVVYRILFLLFAEARRLVPLWHPVYRDSYSIDVLVGQLVKGAPSVGLWEALGAVSRLLHAGCNAGDLQVNAFNGRLFAPSSAPLADRRDLDDEAARRALVSITTRGAVDGSGQERISYRDLGVEQLGAVYETLLDYTPVLDDSPGSRKAPVVSLRTGSGLRKASGTFYTPRQLTRFLVRHTLDPLVRDALPEEILRLRVLDPAMGSGAFLVAACSHLAQAYESALVRTGSCQAHDLGPREHGAIRRTVAERCLFGVDINPMAVQLARLSLWLATLAADRPLSFLDHHLQTGDSLVGAWLSALRRPPTIARRRSTANLPLFAGDAAVGDVMRHALPIRFSLAESPNDTAAEVRAKERALAALNRSDTPLSKWKRAADLWCACWFSSRSGELASGFLELTDALLSGKSALADGLAARYLADARDTASARRFFHWELEFPEVFFGRDGAPLPAAGFDAVLGNPPWDMMRADHGRQEDRRASREDTGRLVRFARDSGLYTSGQLGHANRYQLFVERAIALTRPGGRIGLVLPWGLAADHGSAPLRRLLFSRASVDTLIGFDNRDAVFPIHRSVKFLLATATAGQETTEIACRLGERDPSALDSHDSSSSAWFSVTLTRAAIERLSGHDLSIPNLRSAADLAIAERLAALFPPLGTPDSWGARFGRELNVTDDRAVLRGAGNGLPVIEGKHIDGFRLRRTDTRWTVSARDADRLLSGRHLRPRLAYRDVASPTNRLTLIAAVLPAGCVSTHTVFCLRTALSTAAQYFLCGVFNSFVLNYLARLRVATHVTTAIVERLPVPGRDDPSPAIRRIAALARVLSKREDRDALALLNATVAHLYRFSIDEFRHVLATFPLVPIEERDAALRMFVK